MIKAQKAFSNILTRSMGLYDEDVKEVKEALDVLGTLLDYMEIDEDYTEQNSDSTKAIKVTIPDCISVEEDENYVDTCYPNSDFDKVREFMWSNEDEE